MLPNSSQSGYISMVLIIFALLMATLIFPFKFPGQNLGQSDGFRYCREFVDPSQATVIENVPVDWKNKPALATYRAIKINVPIPEKGLKGNGHHVTEGEKMTLPDNKQYQVLYPTPHNGRSYDFNTEDGEVKGNGIVFLDYGIIFLQHLDDSGKPVSSNEGGEPMFMIDVYQDVTKPPIPQAEAVLKCVDVGAESVTDPVVLVPEQRVSPDQKQVQMQWFVIKQAKALPKAWWTPECKPAIYLYPRQKQLVNVKVYPDGRLTYTDPPYDADKGWTVWANPDGQLQTNSELRATSHDYLYYESKIRDSAIRKPEQGWVVKYSELTNLYNDILPKLGLSPKETQDFVEYWQKSLPEAPYYFVGIVDPGNVDQIEKLEITPKPDSINRVRIYFERLDQPKAVVAPVLPNNEIRNTTNDFRVVEWGGMVKNDLNHPFTCSQ